MPKVDRIRGSIDVPLDEEGRAEAERVGRMFAKAGGVDVIICSDLKRARQTAEIVKRHNPKAIGPEPTADLHPWHLGSYEGQDTKIVIPKIEALTKTPDKRAPGKAPNGTAPGESFNQFEDRVLDFLEDLETFMDKDPEGYGKAMVGTHLRVVKLVEAAEAAGGLGKRRFPVDSMHQMKKEDPGSVFRLSKGKLTPTTDPRAKGIYLVRHGSTALNGDKASS